MNLRPGKGRPRSGSRRIHATRAPFQRSLGQCHHNALKTLGSRPTKQSPSMPSESVNSCMVLMPIVVKRFFKTAQLVG